MTKSPENSKNSALPKINLMLKKRNVRKYIKVSLITEKNQFITEYLENIRKREKKEQSSIL